MLFYLIHTKLLQHPDLLCTVYFLSGSNLQVSTALSRVKYYRQKEKNIRQRKRKKKEKKKAE